MGVITLWWLSGLFFLVDDMFSQGSSDHFLPHLCPLSRSEAGLGGYAREGSPQFPKHRSPNAPIYVCTIVPICC